MTASDGSDITEYEGQFIKDKLDAEKAKHNARVKEKYRIKAMLRQYEVVSSDGAAKVLMNDIIEAIDKL